MSVELARDLKDARMKMELAADKIRNDAWAKLSMSVHSIGAMRRKSKIPMPSPKNKKKKEVKDYKIHLSHGEKKLAKKSFYRVGGMLCCEQICDALQQEFGFFILPEQVQEILTSGLRMKEGGFNAAKGTGVMRMSQWYTLLGYLKFSTEIDSRRLDVRDAFEALGGNEGKKGDVNKAAFISKAAGIGIDLSHRIGEICGGYTPVGSPRYGGDDQEQEASASHGVIVPLRFENFSRDLMMFGKKSRAPSMSSSVAETVVNIKKPNKKDSAVRALSGMQVARRKSISPSVLPEIAPPSFFKVLSADVVEHDLFATMAVAVPPENMSPSRDTSSLRLSGLLSAHVKAVPVAVTVAPKGLTRDEASQTKHTMRDYAAYVHRQEHGVATSNAEVECTRDEDEKPSTVLVVRTEKPKPARLRPQERQYPVTFADIYEKRK